MKNRRAIGALGLFLAGVVAISTAAVFANGKHSGKFSAPEPTPTQTNAQPSSQPGPQPANQNPFNLNTILSEAPPNASQSPFFEAVQIVVRLLLAVILSGILAFRPRKNVPLFRRSLFVSQTQILLAVVAAALMLVVADNTARAF